MTDLAAPTPVTGASKAAATKAKNDLQRLRKRHRAELRFRWYGMAAIALSVAFIVILFGSILRAGTPAFWHSYYVLDVELKPDVIDPSGKRDPKELASADYFALPRDALRETFPDVTERRARNRLALMLSTGAGEPIRRAVMENPGLIGQTVRFSLPLSATTDIYLKGGSTVASTTLGRGVASPSGTSGDINVLLSYNEFATQLLAIKQGLSARANALRTEADRVERASGTQVNARVGELRKEAEALQARFDALGGAEALDDQMPSILIDINGGVVKLTRIDNTRVEGTVLLPLASAVEAQPGSWRIRTLATPESRRKMTDREIVWVEHLKSRGQIEQRFNWAFFGTGDSREPELAGIRGAIMGSIFTLIVTLALCLPTGVMAAIYLEEFAPKNALTDLIEVNINNLAAVPSIVFGLLGLAVFLNLFEMPRSAPIVGGVVLALMTLPTIIIASRAAIRAVPPSIREGALGVGASHQQAVFHHVLPLAMPGIMTGTIVGMAQALGETAPLLMIGMVAFIVDIPSSFTQAATVLPVQIYLWSELPEEAFTAKTSAAIMVLLAFLFAMNAIAIILRKRFERRW